MKNIIYVVKNTKDCTSFIKIKTIKKQEYREYLSKIYAKKGKNIWLLQKQKEVTM